MKGRQITLRNVSPALHQLLRKRSKQRALSMNTLALKLLEEQLGVSNRTVAKRDLSWFVGSDQLEPKVRRVLTSIRIIDPDLWQ